jgi:seryl-tRNA(Sec) selenium transferase
MKAHRQVLEARLHELSDTTLQAFKNVYVLPTYLSSKANLKTASISETVLLVPTNRVKKALKVVEQVINHKKRFERNCERAGAKLHKMHTTNNSGM